MKNYQNQLFFITILYFALGFLHIGFALLGLICFALPFYMYAKTGKKAWCQQYCPRAGLFTQMFSKISLNLEKPDWLKDKGLKRFVLTYFCINLFFAIMSSLNVASGNMAPIAYVRFLILFRIPVDMPQLLHITLSPVFLHISYRVYSIMFTSTILGLLLGFLYRPRTWCTICPISTLTTAPPSPHKKQGRSSAANPK